MKEEKNKQKTIETLVMNLQKAMIADMKAGRMIINADAKKKRTHQEYIYAKTELEDFKRDNCF